MNICPNCGLTSGIVGHVERGTYDGILFWSCVDCGHAWPRRFNVPRLDGRANAAVQEFAVRRPGE